MTVNKNMVPFDTKSPFVTSGIRVGTAALTTRGFKESEMKKVDGWINKVISSPDSAETVKNEIKELTGKYDLFAW